MSVDLIWYWFGELWWTLVSMSIKNLVQQFTWCWLKILFGPILAAYRGTTDKASQVGSTAAVSPCWNHSLPGMSPWHRSWWVWRSGEGTCRVLGIDHHSERDLASAWQRRNNPCKISLTNFMGFQCRWISFKSIWWCLVFLGLTCGKENCLIGRLHHWFSPAGPKKV